VVHRFALHHVREKLVREYSPQTVRIPDIRRSAMVAGEVRIERFALPAAPGPSGKSGKSGAQKFRDARRRRSRRRENGAQNVRRCVGKIAIGHDTRSKNYMSAI
jgi:hypothetical protein